jgi:signal transduction histidine kinase
VRKHLPALVVFVWLTALALSAFVAVLNIYRDRIQENFASAADARILAIQRSLEEKLLIIESIRSLYAIFEGKPQPEFGAFVQPFEGQLEGVQGLLWVVPVTADERAAFESARQMEGVAGFQITQRNEFGNMERAPERPLYFPVYPLLPLDVGEATIGYDMGSSPVRLEAIERSLATGALSASARVDLIQERSAGEYGFLIFSPLFTDTEKGAHTADQLLGFVTGVFRISNIVNDVEGQLTQEEISLTLRDITAPPESQELYTLVPQTNGSVVAGAFARIFQPADHVEGFSIGGRYWEITASALPAYMADKPPVAALMILAAGLFLALGATAYLIVRQIHSERIRGEQERRALAENQLIRSQKLEAIGQLVGGIAHDFNNLLTSIIGYGELALSEMRAETPVSKYIRVILQSSDKGKGLIRKLLSFSRNQPTHAEPRALQPLVENIMLMLQPVMTARIHMSLEAEPDLPPVSVDSTSFDQLLVNLCVNARDAISGAGQIRIGLSRARLDGRCLACGEPINGDWVMLSVADTGSGMAPSVQAQMFKPFFTTKEDGKGTGLGLPIINNVLHGCRGHILVDSAPGKGTTFKLLFPIG